MTTADLLPLLRRGMLAVLLFGCVGLTGELVLLEHYAELTQLVPPVLCVAMGLAIVAHWIGRGGKSVRAIQTLALLMVLSGAMGVFFHGEENLEHAREDAEEDAVAAEGSSVWVTVAKGEAPLLAPGTMIQFGLLALLFAYKHPALRREDA